MIALAIVAIATSSASAAVRYAIPSGGAVVGTCPQNDPCVIEQAFGAALDGDEVRIAPGDYELPSEIAKVANSLTVQGTPGTPSPRLTYTGPLGSSALRLQGSNFTLRNLSVAGGTDGFVSLVQMTDGGGQLDRVRINNSGTGSAFTSRNGFVSIRSSVIRAATFLGAAMNIQSGWVAETTVIADGGVSARALEMVQGAPASVFGHVTVRNSILLGGGNDVVVSAFAPNEYTLDIDYSALDAVMVNGEGVTYTEGAHNVAAAPLLVNAAGAADVHQLPGSPTINAGDPSGSFGRSQVDIDGQPRRLGSALDIGVDEIEEAPIVVTSEARVFMNQVALSGFVNANGAVTRYHFEYGPTSAYGSRTPAVVIPPSGSNALASAIVNGLPVGTLMHARLVATNAVGERRGADVTFTPGASFPGPVAQLYSATLLRPVVRSGIASAVRFGLTERAVITLTIDRLLPGRRQGTRCRTILRTGVRCTKAVRRGVVRVTRDVGPAVRIVVPGRLGGAALAPGRYRLTLTARDSETGVVTTTQPVTLTVTR